ncbi:filamentous hemagglutinin N-terminal domain-containing protein [Synechocystis sp. PCC 7509]|uniref:two-partner secretion domain-containing protein n=1 Tax=Synechocystis sp. PCC 7509 TaxID=927677 RepID=UPI0002ACD24D|nr:filamentous hemagglutinin N-terminal domain-containing protein [Synechocystis sp. PCC 7509]
MSRVNYKTWSTKVAFFSIICTAIATFDHTALAQIESDTSLGSESSTIRQIEPLVEQIDNGAIRGKNLFHSFQQFNIVEGQKAYFSNPVGVENIIGRVTGSNPSNIQGVLGVLGNANLFLLNPNGIIFGLNASLDIRGSFVASTANSLNFADGSQFSATEPQLSPLLTLSVPVGLQFGSNPAAIINRSQASPNGMVNSLFIPVGLQVTNGKTLALVGGNINLDGGNITAIEGRIEIGSVNSLSLVSLKTTNQGWTLGYEGIENFQDIRLSQGSTLDASGESGGSIQIQGKDVILSNASQILAQTQGSGNGGNVVINAQKLIVLDGSQISTAASGFYLFEPPYFIPGTGNGGNIMINASESVEISGISELEEFSGLSSATFTSGNAGDITVNTSKLIVRDRGLITTESSVVLLPDQTILATGQGGNITINASESIELIGGNLSKKTGLSTTTQGSGNAGDLILKTGTLIIRDGAEVSVSSENTGNAGNLEVTASTVSLNNQGKFTATSKLGTGGGNISLNGLNSLLLRGNSEISTNAQGKGNGGNIAISTDLLTALENSDITANANGTGNGGNISITTQGLFLSPDSKITASSEQGIDGVVEIDRLENDPENALLTLPTEPVNISGLIAQGCSSSVVRGSKFVVTGRGGLPPNPQEAFRSDMALADLGKPEREVAPQVKVVAPTNQNLDKMPLVEAQGWVISDKGEVILTASASNVTPSIPWMKSNSCHGS